MRSAQAASDSSAVEVAIVGGGFSGIGIAIALQREGIKSFAVIEAGDEVGGAWHWNRYPGVAVDIPSFSYQFSHSPRTSWSRVYAPGKELQDYADSLVDEHRLRDRLRLTTTVAAARFDEGGDHWDLDLSDGTTLRARHLVSATGILTQPRPPQIPGIGDFAGHLIHTARWRDDVALGGQRVAVIGTGASAVQVIPSIAAEVDRLTIFQRTPIWCLPKLDAPIGRRARWLLDHLPGVRQAARMASQAYVELTFPLAAHYHSVLPLSDIGERAARKHLRQVRDPDVRNRLTPRYAMGCKRPSFSNDYLRTYNEPHVELVTDAIAAVTPTGVRTVDGREHEVDVLVLATGFKVFERGNMPPFTVTGAGGVDLETWWDEHRYQAYEGTSVPGFPNLFMVLGPYGYNGASYFTLIENQARHIVRALRHAHNEDATRIEVTAEANDRYWQAMLSRRPRQVFAESTCGQARSYYFDRHGDTPFRPASTLEAAWRSARYPLADYRFSRAEDRLSAWAACCETPRAGSLLS